MIVTVDADRHLAIRIRGKKLSFLRLAAACELYLLQFSGRTDPVGGEVFAIESEGLWMLSLINRIRDTARGNEYGTGWDFERFPHAI